MARDIRADARKLLDNEATRAIAATAVGEAIRRVGNTRKPASVPASTVATARLAGAGGFAAGAGAVTLVGVAAKRIGKLVTGRKRTALFAEAPGKVASGARKTVEAPKNAVDAFASKLGGGSGTSRGSSSSGTSRPRPTATRGRASGTSRRKPSPGAKPRSTGTGSTRASGTAKTSRSANGSTKRSSPTTSRSSNGSRAKTARAKSQARPTASRRS